MYKNISSEYQIHIQLILKFDYLKILNNLIWGGGQKMGKKKSIAKQSRKMKILAFF